MDRWLCAVAPFGSARAATATATRRHSRSIFGRDDMTSTSWVLQKRGLSIVLGSALIAGAPMRAPLLHHEFNRKIHLRAAHAGSEMGWVKAHVLEPGRERGNERVVGLGLVSLETGAPGRPDVANRRRYCATCRIDGHLHEH